MSNLNNANANANKVSAQEDAKRRRRCVLDRFGHPDKMFEYDVGKYFVRIAAVQPTHAARCEFFSLGLVDMIEFRFVSHLSRKDAVRPADAVPKDAVRPADSVTGASEGASAAAPTSDAPRERRRALPEGIHVVVLRCVALISHFVSLLPPTSVAPCKSGSGYTMSALLEPYRSSVDCLLFHELLKSPAYTSQTRTYDRETIALRYVTMCQHFKLKALTVSRYDAVVKLYEVPSLDERELYALVEREGLLELYYTVLWYFFNLFSLETKAAIRKLRETSASASSSA